MFRNYFWAPSLHKRCSLQPVDWGIISRVKSAVCHQRALLGSHLLYATLSGPSHIRTCQRTPGSTCVDLWHRGPGRCGNGSAHTASAEEGHNQVAGSGSVTSDWLTTVATQGHESHHASFRLDCAVSVQTRHRKTRHWGGWSNVSLLAVQCPLQVDQYLVQKSIQCCLMSELWTLIHTHRHAHRADCCPKSRSLKWLVNIERKSELKEQTVTTFYTVLTLPFFILCLVFCLMQ